MSISAAGRRFGSQVVQIEFETLLPNPFRRPVGWALILGALLPAVMVWTLLPPMPFVVAGPVAYLTALLVFSVTYRVAAPIVEARAFDAATYRWLEQPVEGQAGAFARPDRRGRLTLYSVWARPRGQGIGGRLMRQIIDDTEPAGDLWLVAVNARVADFYRRIGFRRVGRELLGHRMVFERVPRSSA